MKRLIPITGLAGDTAALLFLLAALACVWAVTP